MWKQINAVFDCLPFTAIVEEKILCVHAGRSRGVPTTWPAILKEPACAVPCRRPFPRAAIPGAAEEDPTAGADPGRWADLRPPVVGPGPGCQGVG